RQAQRQPDVKAEEGGEPAADADGDRSRDPLGRLLAAEQVEDEDLPAALPLQRMEAALAERPREGDLHRRAGSAAKWSYPADATSRSPRLPRRPAPSPSSSRPIRVTGISGAPSAETAPLASGGAAKRSS